MSELSDRLQSRLGDSYTVEHELGGGGMSRVFIATEKSLGRRIVVKVLPPETAAAVSIERFRREIQVCAALQHPHIVPLLSAGEADGLPYYTMPFVPGESLRAHLARHGELAVNDALHLLRDVASALAYAHREGVVHRDIKPENVMLSGGVAVVTDFGVAKAVDVSATDGGDARTGLTSLGMALGTPAYMAPEQATADPHVDHRADIYSFGCLAYELLTGASPFAGRPLQRVLAAHVTEVPAPVQSRRANVPPALAALVMRCLEKHPGDRPQSADELIAAIDGIGTPSGGTEPTDERLRAAKKPFPAALAAALAFLVLVAAGGVWAMRREPASFTPGAITPVAITPEIETEPSISPDGRFVAYVGGPRTDRRIFVRQIGGTRSIPVSNEGTLQSWPRWSPDGTRLTYSASSALYVVEALGGVGRVVASVLEAIGTLNIAGTPSWAPDGRSIIFADATGLWTLSLEGGSPQKLIPGQYLHSPSYAPDGKRIAYVRGTRSTFANVSTSAIWIRAEDGRLTRISDEVHINLSPVWTPDGRAVLYVSNVDGARDIYHQRLNSDGSPRGPAVRVSTGLNPLNISLSADGKRLAYDVAHIRSNVWSLSIPATGAASMASAVEVTTGTQRVEGIGLSRDGRWLVYDSNRGGNFDIYKLSLEGGEPTQLTTDPANDFVPSWSPDGREVAFHSTRHGGLRQIYVVQADGRNETAVTSDERHHFMPTWAPGGDRLSYLATEGATQKNSALFVVSRERGTWSRPRRITPAGATVGFARWSPQGSTIGFPGDSAVWIVAADSGQPRRVVDLKRHGRNVSMVAWGSDPSTIFFQAESASVRSIWSVPVSGGSPRLLLRDDDRRRIARQEFATDGRRLYFTLAGDESDIFVMELKSP